MGAARRQQARHPFRDERLIRLSPSEAFGEWDPSAVLTMRQATLDSDGHLEDGMTLRVETVDGSAALCRVYRLTEERVALDFNHPLAGKTLLFKIKLIGITDQPTQQAACDCGSGSSGSSCSSGSCGSGCGC